MSVISNCLRMCASPSALVSAEKIKSLVDIWMIADPEIAEFSNAGERLAASTTNQ
jgi:hypothetical protein